MSAEAQATLAEFVSEPAPDFDASGLCVTTPRFRLRNKSRAQAREWYWNEYDRDSYECPTCGGDGPFDVHHRDGDPLNNHPLNLVAICWLCHKSEHRRRRAVQRVQDWKDDYSDIIEVDA
ncbi:HNH endonuclease [Haloarcula sp. S1CR25-12]|uniref:HNH endonuclease n=1 Tax=Haloarcula saliterrae TaxID=2950534 RepID=A0ABU2F8F5_9EURY|nr:HNH endonuclease signature motif containing protein [Haloarcula sp. S1CR25-12]MDS0258529.1 HNH endonuclease [Haloarcula sp. S1CR25-12]